ncbi:MAG: TldD/PmbA family protein [Brevinematia bacterium]
MPFNFNLIKDRILSRKGDVIVIEENSTTVKFEGSKLNSVNNFSKEGLGVRIIKDGKVGFSSTNDVSKVDEIFMKAEEVSKFGEELDISFPKQPKATLNENFVDPSLEDVSQRDMIELGEEIISSIKEIDHSIEVNLEIEKSFIRKSVINSSGLDLSNSKTIWGVSVEGVYVGNDDSLLWLYDSKFSTRYDIDFSPLVSYLRNIYLYSKDTAKIESGKYPVIFAPTSLITLVDILCLGVNGENVFKGISPIKDKINEKVFSEKFSLIDDPHIEVGISSQPFDDEGVITNYKEVISSGVLKSFINDLRIGYLRNDVSTGNGFRNYFSLPKPSFSNVVVMNGDVSLSSMIGSIDKGLIVYQLLGGGQSNVNAGEFSVNIETGFLIKDGHIIGRVKDTMLFGNVYELFKRIIQISKETKAVYDHFLPYILFEEVNVASDV